jgi:outer membrane receptor for ferrienterochelin and colicins
MTKHGKRNTGPHNASPCNTPRAHGRHRADAWAKAVGGGMTAAGLSLAVALGASAQTTAGGSGDDAALSTVVVTATGFEQHISEAPASISVITRAELNKRPFRDLTDALNDIEGVSVTGISNEKDIFMRGLGGTYTLILVNGVRQSTRDTRPNGSSGFEQSFIPPADAIERIEVVRGPMSSLYGSDAMGGVINIITRKVAKTWGGSVGADATLQTHSDSGNAYQGTFYVAGPLQSDALGLQVWGRAYQRDEDEILNGFNRSSDTDLTARLAFTPTRSQDIALEAGKSGVRRDNSGGKVLAATASDTYNRNTRDHVTLSHSGRWDGARSDVSVAREEAQRWTYTENAAGGFTEAARAPKIVNTVADAKLSMPLGSHWLVLGGQFNEAKLTDQNPGLRDNIDHVFKVTQKAIFIEDEWKLVERFSLTGGARLDDHKTYGKHTSPRLYGVWKAADTLTVKGGISRGFRAPDLRIVAPGYVKTTGGANCSYGPNGTCGVVIGDPDIKPETSTSVEIAALWDNKAGATASATLFRTKFKDKIADALVTNTDGSIVRWEGDRNYRLWYSYNIDDAIIKGVELNGRLALGKQLALKGNYTFTDSKQEGGAYDGYALARTPRHALNLRADWTYSDRLSAWSALNYHGKEINAAARAGSNGTTIAGGVKQYGAYTMVDVGGTFQLTGRTTLNVALYNLADKRLDELTYNTIGDGRRLWVSVKQAF